jgi:site-specific DNA recombinase
VGRIRDLLSKPLELAAQFPDLTVKNTRLIVAAAQHRAEQLSEIGTRESVRLIGSILGRVVVREAEIQIEINHPKLGSELLGNDNNVTSDPGIIKLLAPLLNHRGALAKGFSASEMRSIKRSVYLELPTLHQSAHPPAAVSK